MWFWNLIMAGLELLAALFVVTVGIAVLAVVVFFVIDRFQTKDAVRRNYPVLGRFRHIFSELGEFFRQYFFAMDREEMPFNRAQRNWIGRAASGKGNTVAFGFIDTRFECFQNFKAFEDLVGQDAVGLIVGGDLFF